MDKMEASQIPALTLAYIGDGYYELTIRRYLLGKGNLKVQKLHKKAVSLVRADFQSDVYRYIENKLTDDELSQLKRGRNVKSGHCPKNGSMSRYRQATGVECLVGYLYLTGDISRLDEIFSMIYELVPDDKEVTL